MPERLTNRTMFSFLPRASLGTPPRPLAVNNRSRPGAHHRGFLSSLHIPQHLPNT